MPTPEVLSEEQVAAAVADLCTALLEARLEAGRTTRDVAAAGRVNLGTLYRIEQARIQPAYLTFARIAEVLGKRLELDDDRDRPRRLARHQVPLTVGALWPAGMSDGSEDYRQQVRLQYRLAWMGSELRFARHQRRPGTTDAELCAALRMSHHTLHGVEIGPTTERERDAAGQLTLQARGWPRLASIVAVAAFSGYRVRLVDEAALLRLPPWWPGGVVDVLPATARLADMELD